MAWTLSPKLRTRRRMMMRGAVCHPQINPGVVDGDPPAILGLDEKQRFLHASVLARMIRPIDPAGRMAPESLKAFRVAAGKEAA